MPQFAAGVVKFQEKVFPDKRDLFERLSHGQSPEALFITCSDSRIETAMITQTDPGELFIIRNAGNIVPPHTKQTGGTTASIEFAVAAPQGFACLITTADGASPRVQTNCHAASVSYTLR